MTPDQAKVIMDFVAGCIERESATTKKVLAAVPEGHDEYKPHEKCMPAMKLASHIALAEHMFLAGIAAGSFADGAGAAPPQFATGADISIWYGETVAKDVDGLRALTPEQCSTVIAFHEVFKMPAYAWAQLSLTHAIHHRGQLSAYLRPMGGRVPAIYGPSGDDDAGAKG